MTFDFSKLAKLARQMGAEPVLWAIQAKTKVGFDWTDQLKTTGIEIDISEVVSDERGLLTYKGEQVLLHIKDIRQSPDELEAGNTGYRFHVAECTKLQEMRDVGRFDRYVVSRRTQGTFLVHGTDRITGEGRDVEAPLCVCKLCLKHLNYKGYEAARVGKKKTIWSEFSVESFLNEFAPLFSSLPKFDDQSAPVQYVSNWSEVSTGYRAKVGWRCENGQCSVMLEDHKSLLHVHHRNGVKGDNGFANLRALCVVCHAQEHGHSMHVTPAAEKLIKQLRAAQRDR